MAALVNGAEAGTADGTTVTAGNSGGSSDNAFDSVSIGAGAALTFDNTHTHGGNHSYKYVPPNASVTSTAIWSTSMGAQATIYGRLYMYGDDNPVTSIMSVFRANSGATQCAFFGISSTGKITIRDSASATIATFTNALTLSAWNRIEFSFTFSTTNGLYDVRLYPADSTTATETKSGSGQNFGASTADSFRFIHATTTNQGSTARTFWFEDFQINTTALPGPAVSPNAGNAAGTGSAGTASLTVAPSGGNAAGTGTSGAPAASVAPNTGAGTGTGAAAAPASKFQPNAGNSAGTGSSLAPAASLSTTAGAGTGSGSSAGPTSAVNTSPSAATGTGAAAASASSLAPNAGAAAGTGLAFVIVPGASVYPGTASGTGTSYTPDVTEITQARGFGTVTLAALASTVSASGKPASHSVTGKQSTGQVT